MCWAFWLSGRGISRSSRDVRMAFWASTFDGQAWRGRGWRRSLLLMGNYQNLIFEKRGKSFTTYHARRTTTTARIRTRPSTQKEPQDLLCIRSSKNRADTSPALPLTTTSRWMVTQPLALWRLTCTGPCNMLHFRSTPVVCR